MAPSCSWALLNLTGAGGGGQFPAQFDPDVGQGRRGGPPEPGGAGGCHRSPSPRRWWRWVLSPPGFGRPPEVWGCHPPRCGAVTPPRVGSHPRGRKGSPQNVLRARSPPPLSARDPPDPPPRPSGVPQWGRGGVRVRVGGPKGWGGRGEQRGGLREGLGHPRGRIGGPGTRSGGLSVGLGDPREGIGGTQRGARVLQWGLRGPGVGLGGLGGP